jgi:hypothetical protein
LLLEDVGGVLDLSAAGTREVAAEQRLEHQDQGVALSPSELLPQDVRRNGPHLGNGNAHIPANLPARQRKPKWGESLQSAPLSGKRLIILAPMRIEAAAAKRAIGDGNSEIEIHTIGIRATRMPKLPEVRTAIVAGLAGALDPRLQIGDLVLDTPVEGLPAELPWHVGPIHTVDVVASTPAEKSELFRRSGALAVDMEQAIVRAALPADVRLIGLRAISDRADDAVDPTVLRLVDDVGRPRPLAIARTLLPRPGLIPHLRRLNANARVALTSLAKGLAAVVAEIV